MSKQKFAVFDIDGTLHDSALGVDFLVALSHAGLTTRPLKKEYAQWQIAADRMAYFKEHFGDIYESGLSPVTRAKLTQVAHELACNTEKRIFDELRQEIARHKTDRTFLVAISHSPAIAVEALTKLLGFNAYVGSDFLFDKNETFIGPNHRSSDEKNKGLVLTRLVEQHRLDWSNSTAYGDSLDDLTMLELVEHPVAVNPSAELYDEALARGWRVIRTA